MSTQSAKLFCSVAFRPDDPQSFLQVKQRHETPSPLLHIFAHAHLQVNVGRLSALDYSVKPFYSINDIILFIAPLQHTAAFDAVPSDGQQHPNKALSGEAIPTPADILGGGTIVMGQGQPSLTPGTRRLSLDSHTNSTASLIKEELRYCTTSIGVAAKGQPVCGVVYFPFARDMSVAGLGEYGVLSSRLLTDTSISQMPFLSQIREEGGQQGATVGGPGEGADRREQAAMTVNAEMVSSERERVTRYANRIAMLGCRSACST